MSGESCPSRIRSRFLKVIREFCVKITPSLDKQMRENNFHTEIKRSRPQESLRLPSEGELDQLLIAAGLLDLADSIPALNWRSSQV